MSPTTTHAVTWHSPVGTDDPTQIPNNLLAMNTKELRSQFTRHGWPTHMIDSSHPYRRSSWWSSQIRPMLQLAAALDRDTEQQRNDPYPQHQPTNWLGHTRIGWYAAQLRYHQRATEFDDDSAAVAHNLLKVAQQRQADHKTRWANTSQHLVDHWIARMDTHAPAPTTSLRACGPNWNQAHNVCWNLWVEYLQRYGRTTAQQILVGEYRQHARIGHPDDGSYWAGPGGNHTDSISRAFEQLTDSWNTHIDRVRRTTTSNGRLVALFTPGLLGDVAALMGVFPFGAWQNVILLNVPDPLGAALETIGEFDTVDDSQGSAYAVALGNAHPGDSHDLLHTALRTLPQEAVAWRTYNGQVQVPDSRTLDQIARAVTATRNALDES